MSTEQVVPTPSVGVAKRASIHPLSPLTSREIVKSAELIRGIYPQKTNLQFKIVTLQEPEKAQLIPFLESEHRGAQVPRIDRKAFVNYYIRNTVCLVTHIGEKETWIESHSLLMFSFPAGQIP